MFQPYRASLSCTALSGLECHPKAVAHLVLLPQTCADGASLRSSRDKFNPNISSGPAGAHQRPSPPGRMARTSFFQHSKPVARHVARVGEGLGVRGALVSIKFYLLIFNNHTGRLFTASSQGINGTLATYRAGFDCRVRLLYWQRSGMGAPPVLHRFARTQ